MFGEFINAEPVPHLRADQVTNGISDLLAPPIGTRWSVSSRHLGSGAWSGRLDLALPAGSAGPLHGPHSRGGRRHDARRGWGARALVAVAHKIFRQAGAGGGKPPGCNSVRNVWPKTSNRISGGNGAWRRRSPARATGAACSTAAQPAVRDWRRSARRRCGPRTIAPPHGFDLASAKAPRLAPGARRAAANLAALGRRVTDADAAVADAILALPAKLDLRRAAALTALSTSDRARALPALAGEIDRLFAAATNGAASRKRRVEKAPAAPAGVLAMLCSRPMRPYASGAAAASEEIAAVRREQA